MPEFRRDPVTGRWVIISVERAKRPSAFVQQSVHVQGNGASCPFCYGNEAQTPPEVLAYGRNNGAGFNAPGWSVRVVPNKFPALGIEGDLHREGHGLFDRMSGIGAHEVIIESPDHCSTLANLPERAVAEVLMAYRDRTLDLKRDSRFRYVLIFKNHGEAAGASLEHSHSQLIALPIVPEQVREELDGARRYFGDKERCIYCDIIRQETESGVRVVSETRHFVTLAPYAPRFPFELCLLPKEHGSAFENSRPALYEDLARALKENLNRLDSALNFPAYNFLIHTSPLREEENEYYHWHFEIMPRLTRVAGFEWATGFYICPTSPEEAARFLREAQVGTTCVDGLLPA